MEIGRIEFKCSIKEVSNRDKEMEQGRGGKMIFLNRDQGVAEQIGREF